jgi:hypothetical protein
MGVSGPIPKRAAERRRRNKTEPTTVVSLPEPPAAEPDSAPAVKIEAPPLGFSTNLIAEQWYASLADSGQAQFYEPSDWQAARVVAHELGRALNGDKPSAMLFAAVWSAMGELLTTEGARRRVRMEINRGKPEDTQDATVTALDEYRASIGG